MTFSRIVIRKSKPSLLPFPEFPVRWMVLILVEGAPERGTLFHSLAWHLGHRRKAIEESDTLKTSFGRIKRNWCSIKVFSSFPQTPFCSLLLLVLSSIQILLSQNQALLIHICFHFCSEQREKIMMNLLDLLHEHIAPSSSRITYFRLCALESCF